MINEANIISLDRVPAYTRAIKIGDRVFPLAVYASAGGAEFYKCSAVHGAYDVETVVISGCPVDAANGEYIPTEFTTEDYGGNKHNVYKHETADYYYYYSTNYMQNCIGTDYAADTNVLYTGGVGSSWMSTSDWMDVSGMTAVNGTVTMDTDVPKTWDGYKAVLSGGVYTFEETLTSGLTYSDIKPQKYGVYNDGATVKADWLVRDYPVEDLVFFAPLQTDIELAETGQTLTSKYAALVTVSGQAATKFDSSKYSYVDCTKSGIGYPAANSYTAMFNFCIDATYNSGWLFGIAGGSDYGAIWFRINSGDAVVHYGSSNPEDAATNVIFPVEQNIWYTVTVNIDAKTKKTTVYLGKIKVGELNRYYGLNDGNIYIGRSRGGSDYGSGYMNNVIVYNRALSEVEIGQLVDKFGFTNSVLASPSDKQRLLYWNMNDTGTAAVDSVYGISLATVGTINAGVTGVNGTCWEVPTGSSGYLSGTNNKLAMPQKFTLHFAVNVSNTTSGCLIDFGGLDSNSGFGVWYNGSNLGMRIAQSYNNYGTPITVGEWHWVTFTYDGSYMKMYLDGTQTQSVAYTGAIGYNRAIKFFMRGDKDGEGQTYGKIDEVSLYNYAMTESEIAELV